MKEETILKIEVVSIRDEEQAVPVLSAVFAPFGSLTSISDFDSFLESFVAWVSICKEQKPELAKKIMALIFTATTDHYSRIDFGYFEIGVVTPNSGTQISLYSSGGGQLSVTVDFGEDGSSYRAQQMLEGLKLLKEVETKKVVKKQEKKATPAYLQWVGEEEILDQQLYGARF